MKPPWIYRSLLNPLRAWAEDRRAPECAYLDQMREVWRVEDRARRARPAYPIGLGSRRAAGRRAADSVPKVRVWQIAVRALSRLLALRGRRRMAPREVVAWRRRA